MTVTPVNRSLQRRVSVSCAISGDTALVGADEQDDGYQAKAGAVYVITGLAEWDARDVQGKSRHRQWRASSPRAGGPGEEALCTR